MKEGEQTARVISFKQVMGLVIIIIIAALPLALLAWMMESGEPGLFFGTFTYVLSGQLFASGWDRIHAGFTLDQPTIGKWYFWFTVFTVFSLTYMAVVRRFCVRQSRPLHWIFVIGLTPLCLFLVCLLTIPFFWLIQYVNAMGYTPRRIEGILYGIGGYMAILLFYVWAVRFKKQKISLNDNP